ncbi:AI-2E family transporter [Kangiella sediminilitoris]|uniref:Membrane protein n=1 Tax=Kangiella sediminilitoris TaxID=1144748 RepID=A0A1B3B8H0_9GAMM|nr:AI-2E family transporter [Kangiella sediminilitoris]AOE49061.1 membrane protein [Kangiella sediminilitoris]
MTIETSRVTNVLLSIAATFIIIAGLKAASSFVVPVILSLFVSIIIGPLYFAIANFEIPKTQKTVPDWLAMILVVLFMSGLFFLMGRFIGNSVEQFSSNLPEYEKMLREKFEGILIWLEGLGFNIPEQSLAERFSPSTVMSLSASVLNGLGGMVSNVFLIVLTSIFLLMEASVFGEKMQRAFPNAESKAHLGLNQVIQKIKRYATIKSIVSLLTGVLISTWLVILDVEYPFLWGLVAFMFNFVPNIGSIIAAIPAVLMSWLTEDAITTPLLVAAGYLMVNFVVGNLVEPKFMGKGLGLSTLIVFLSLLFWGWVLGPVGMLLSVPLTIIVKIVLDSNKETQWIGIMLGDK